MSVGHYENFPVASFLLPKPLRAPVAVIYRFARSADDLADEGSEPAEVRLQKLGHYREQLRQIAAGVRPEDPLFAAMARTVAAHALPLQPFHDLLDAFSQDVVKNRYATYVELLDYCRRSANPIGRLLLHLFGMAGEAAQACSDAICSALQLVNFWQDVTIDWQKGRVYLPQDEMLAFGVTEAHLERRICDAAWCALMRFQCARARELMRQGAPLAGMLTGRSALEIKVTIQGGLRILELLERAGYDAFRRRPVLRWMDWPLLLWRA